MSYSPNGTRIVTGPVDKTIRIWDTESGAVVCEPRTGHFGGVDSVAVSPNVRSVISGSSDRTIRTWNAATGAEDFNRSRPLDFARPHAHEGVVGILKRSWVDPVEYEPRRHMAHGPAPFTPTSSPGENEVKHGVLVFNGPGICPLSRDGLVESLRTALDSRYWVGTIDHEGLRVENWTESCVLLVFPHCTRRQPYAALDVDLPTIRRIRQFVVDGGSFLGICGGAYFASKTAEWYGNQWGSANLAFWPWLSKGPHLQGGAQTHEFTLPFLIGEYATNGWYENNATPNCDLHYHHGGAFIPQGDCDFTRFTLMGRYSTTMCAGVRCTVGAGSAVLWHARLERSFRDRDVEHGFRMSYSREYDAEVCF